MSKFKFNRIYFDAHPAKFEFRYYKSQKITKNFEQLTNSRNQKGHRRLAVFRLGALTGSLLTQEIIYLKLFDWSTYLTKLYIFFIFSLMRK